MQMNFIYTASNHKAVVTVKTLQELFALNLLIQTSVFNVRFLFQALKELKLYLIFILYFIPFVFIVNELCVAVSTCGGALT